MTVLHFDGIDDLKRNLKLGKVFGHDLTPIVANLAILKAVRGAIEFDELLEDNTIETTRLEFGPPIK